MKIPLLHRNLQFKIRKPLYLFIIDNLLAILVPVLGYYVFKFAGPPLSNTPLLILIPIIVASAWNGGFTSGLLASISSALVLNYFSQSGGAWFGTSYANIIQFVLLLVEGIFLSIIIDNGQRQDKMNEYRRAERNYKKTIEDLMLQKTNFENEIRQRDEFLSIASHELKTPLTSMLLQTQTALHNIRNVSVAHFSFESLLKMLESVENQTKRLSKMINDLLAVSVITVGNLNLEYEEIDLGKLVKGVLTDFQVRIEKENYEFILHIDEKVIGHWDKIRIEQAISNFISNAIKYGNHKPIEIKVKNDKKNAEFIIIDQGIGISGHKQKRIFELFQRAVSPEEYKGLGVGLYITQKIVYAHGGSVDVSSRPDQGSKFVMKIPLKRPNVKGEKIAN